MKFIDEAKIFVQSGNGGRGCVSFRRERFIPKGGPDGGDGGDGGSIILSVSERKRTLYDFKFKHVFKAENGGYGKGNQQTGRNGKPLIIEIPPGTLIRNVETGEVLCDLVHPGETFEAAKGGRGGKGNKFFSSATNRAPKFAQPGEPGQAVKLELELKLIADVGLVGLPNAGKSTLISAMTTARPKIGAYPFTTLTPNLGVVFPDDAPPFVMADIPGLIEGAHQGAGLGTRFLKHIERTRVLIHLIDASSIDEAQPMSAYLTVNRELHQFSSALAEKPQIIVLNKLDIPAGESGAQAFVQDAQSLPVMTVSAIRRSGIAELTTAILALLRKHHA